MKPPAGAADKRREMHPAILPAALALTAATGMALYVAMQRDKNELYWPLLALLASLVLWTSGTILRFSARDVPALDRSLHVLFLGVFLTPPLWLLVAARYSRSEALARRRWLPLEILLPSLLAYLAFLSNERHHLVLRELGFEVLERGGLAWAGPVFWAFIAWAYVCVLGGVLLYLAAARSLVVEDARPRAVLLAVASVIPVAASAVYLFRLLPVRFDLTPSALVVSLVLICVAVLRYQLLESLPLARRDVIENLHDGVLMSSAGGVILDLNPAAERILGHARAELRGRPLVEALTAFGEGGDVADLYQGLTELLPDASPLVAEVRTDDDRLIEVNAAWVRDARGRPAGRFALLRDRTEERRYERVVRQAQKLRTVGTLASGIAHEVNNPLAFIRANLTQLAVMGERVEAALEQGGSGAKLARELEELGSIAAETLDGIGRIEKIVSGMRRLASAGDERLRRVAINEVVEDALRLSNLGRDPRVRIERRLAADLPAVEAAPERLVQAILNLLLNARQALEGCRGSIEVESRLRDGRLEVLVSDDGPGVPDEIQERIFDPFFTTKDPDQGTGLGLAIAFDILRDHGGVLELRSRPGRGACFVLVLPLHP
jgi:PAS domain S-box-containing protein